MIPIAGWTTPVVGGVLIRPTAAVDGLGIIERLLAQRTTSCGGGSSANPVMYFEKRASDLTHHGDPLLPLEQTDQCPMAKFDWNMELLYGV